MQIHYKENKFVNGDRGETRRQKYAAMMMQPWFASAGMDVFQFTKQDVQEMGVLSYELADVLIRECRYGLNGTRSYNYPEGNKK